jgi:hypothetical protein
MRIYIYSLDKGLSWLIWRPPRYPILQHETLCRQNAPMGYVLLCTGGLGPLYPKFFAASIGRKPILESEMFG